MVSIEETKDPDTAFFRDEEHQAPIQSRIRSDDKENGEAENKEKKWKDLTRINIFYFWNILTIKNKNVY